VGFGADFALFLPGLAVALAPHKLQWVCGLSRWTPRSKSLNLGDE
jgi:hypothetical protein